MNEVPDLTEYQRNLADMANAVRTARELKRKVGLYATVLVLVTSLLTTAITFVVFNAATHGQRNLVKRVDRNARIARQSAQQAKREHQVLLCFFTTRRWRPAPMDALLRCQRLVVSGRFIFPPGRRETGEQSGQPSRPSDEPSDGSGVLVEPREREPSRQDEQEEPPEEPSEEPPPSRPPPTKSPSPEPSNTPIVCTPEVDPLPMVCIQEPPFMSLLVAVVVVAVVA